MMALRTFQWMKLRSWVTTSAVVLASFFFFHSHASAVVLTNSDTTANNGQTSAAGTTAPYTNVGLRGNGQATVIYLGNDWALTAAHVTVHSVGSTINDAPYGNYTVPSTPTSTYVDPGNNTLLVDNYVSLNGQQVTIDQTVPLYNGPSSSQPNSPIDLQLVHLTSSPGLSPLSIATSLPTDSQAVTMIGDGKDLGTLQPGMIGGYSYYNLTSTENVPRWGTNAIDPGSVNSSLMPLGENLLNASNQSVAAYGYMFTTTFAPPSGSNQGAQATVGDSGGAVFEQLSPSGPWSLVGMVYGVNGPLPSGNLAGQINYSSNAYLGEQSYMIDLAPYAAQIASVIAPEPSGLVLGAFGVVAALIAGLRARRRSA
jgi:hypothetical protein